MSNNSSSHYFSRSSFGSHSQSRQQKGLDKKKTNIVKFSQTPDKLTLKRLIVGLSGADAGTALMQNTMTALFIPQILLTNKTGL